MPTLLDDREQALLSVCEEGSELSLVLDAAARPTVIVRDKTSGAQTLTLSQPVTAWHW